MYFVQTMDIIVKANDVLRIGTRICQGRFIALMELYKFIASTVLQWDFEIVTNEDEFGGQIHISHGYMQQPSGPIVKVKRRCNVVGKSE
jgi:hypothetical protein